VSAPILEIVGVSKHYHALRPLRIAHLIVQPGEHVAVIGLDQPAAEVFVNLVTGAFLPDEGEIRVFGRSTAALTDSTDWLALVDRFGIVSDRAVLLDALTVLQNLAMPFSIDVEPLDDGLRQQAAGLARTVGIAEAEWDRLVGRLDGASRLLVRLARALALGPALVLLEHPSASIERHEAERVGGLVRGVLGRVAPAPDGSLVSSLTLTADREFAGAIGRRTLTLDPATGRLTGGRRKWFFG
jgi:ABC-type transporter Mla maintaining outer membrane lipid asymmetry ATPase subunit MlaF